MTTAKALETIILMRKTRWDKGLAARRQSTEPFVGDPREELVEELVDGMNYLAVLADNYDMETWLVNTLEHHLLQACVLVLTNGKELTKYPVVDTIPRMRE